MEHQLKQTTLRQIMQASRLSASESAFSEYISKNTIYGIFRCGALDKRGWKIRPHDEQSVDGRK
jgi:hypothetical protein